MGSLIWHDVVCGHLCIPSERAEWRLACVVRILVLQVFGYAAVAGRVGQRSPPIWLTKLSHSVLLLAVSMAVLSMLSLDLLVLPA